MSRYKLWYDADAMAWQIIDTRTDEKVVEAGNKASAEEELARLNK